MKKLDWHKGSKERHDTNVDILSGSVAGDYLVILVHGTWARGMIPFLKKKVAPWCEDGSKIRESCKNVLGENVTFYPFNWSGRNSSTSRTHAAEKLNDTLHHLSIAYPTTKLVLVCHSHGGNIAMYSMNNQSSIDSVDGLAFFSTPFLHASQRSYKGSSDWVQLLAGTIGFLIVLVLCAITVLGPYLFIAWLYSSGVIESRDSLEVAGLITVVLFLLAVTIWKKFSYIRQVIFKKLQKTAHKFLDETTLPSHLPMPTFIIRDTSDEASNALSVTQFASWSLSKFLGLIALISTPSEFINSSRKHIPPQVWRYFFSILFVAFVTGELLDDKMNYYMGFIIIPLLSMLGILLITFISYYLLVGTCLILIVPILLLLSLLMAPFGIKYTILGLFLDVSAEAAPPGTWQIHQISNQSNQITDKEEQSQHSTYDDSEALKAFEIWMQNYIRN